MKRKFLLIVLSVIAALSFTLFAAGCSNGNGEVPSTIAGEDTLMTSVKTNPKDTDPITAVFAALGKLNGYSTYESESYGTSVAEKGFITYTQKSVGKNIKHGDEFYTESVSNSTFVNVRHEAFTKNDNVAYRIDGGTIKNSTATNYKDVYGVTPAKLLTGHIFNGETIIYAKFAGEKDGLYTFEVVLEKDKANALLSRQMKNFGNLNGHPSFTANTIVTLALKSDFTPVSVAYESRYAVSVAVLGSVDCVENNEVKFKNFNESNSIPDTEAFNTAIGSSPSEVKPSKETTVDENGEKIMSALLNADMERGVSLNGNVAVNGITLPVKIQLAANVNEILAGNAQAAQAIKAKITVANVLSAIYSDNKVYIDFAGLKFFVEVPDLPIEDLAKLGSVDINKYIKTENDGDGTYKITLPNFVNATVYAVLNELGLASDNGYKDFVLALSLYIPRERIGVIAFDLKTDIISASFAFNLSDEKLVLPENFDDYSDTEINFGMSGKIAVNLSSFSSEPYIIDADVAVTYDITELNPISALKAEAKIVLDDNIKELLNMLPFITAMMPDVKLPGWLFSLSSANSITLLYENGKMFFILPATDGEGNDYIAYATKIELTSAETTALSDDLNLSGIIDLIEGLIDLDFSDVAEIIPFIFNAEMAEGRITVSLGNFVNGIVRQLWQNVPEAIIDSLGATGSLAATLLELYKPTENIYAVIDLNERALDLNLNVFDLGSSNVYMEENKYEVKTLLSVSLFENDLSDYSFGWDTAAIVTEFAPVKEVIEAIDALYPVQLTDSYKKLLSETKAKFDALSEKQKTCVYNAYETSLFGDKTLVFDSVEKTTDTLISEANNFIEAVSSDSANIAALAKQYDSMTESQKTYLESNAADTIASFTEKRIAAEATANAEVVAAINDISALTEETPDELLARLTALNELYIKYTALYKGSVNNEVLLLAAIKETAEAYGKAVIAEAKTLTETLKDMNYRCDKTIDEMLTLYDITSKYYEKYYDDPSSLEVFEFVKAACPEAEAACYKVSYYTCYSYIGFRTGAVSVAEKAIADIIANKDNYSAEKLEELCNKADKLCSLTDDTVINGYQELQDILFDLM